MEPIRPDDDELRAERPVNAPERKAQAQNKPRSSGEGSGGKAKPPKSAKRDGENGEEGVGKGSGAGLLALWVLVVVVAIGSVTGWYSQSQRIEALEGQLEEADYWARQSKLALARFEGDLTETGESLQERGESMAEQIESQKARLDEADSEIRKLWVVANERNKKRLNDQQEQIAAAEAGLAENRKVLADVSATVEKVRVSLGEDLAALSKQTQTSVSALEDTSRQSAEQLTTLGKQLAEVDQVVERRVRRFEQEQKLGISGIEGRLSALEAKVSDNSGDNQLKNELATLERNVQAIDSSRAQLTSRLVRLSEEVNQLRSQVARQ